MSNTALRQQLVKLLVWGDAHQDLESAITGFPRDLCAETVAGLSHTPWRLLEHMRLAQWDILEFSRNAGHISPPFPDGYWPEPEAVGSPEDWVRTGREFLKDLRAMQDLVQDPATDLFAVIPHGSGQTILREALLIADHNAYHFGQLMMIRRAHEEPAA